MKTYSPQFENPAVRDSAPSLLNADILLANQARPFLDVFGECVDLRHKAFHRCRVNMV